MATTIWRIGSVGLVLLGGLAVEAQSSRPPNSGYQLNRYEPTPPGESSFRVDVPRFGSDAFSFGLSLDYAHKPLVLGVEDDAGKFQPLRVLIEHQVVGHLDLAFRLCDCAAVSVSLPLVLERGQPPGGDYDWASSRRLPMAASSITGLTAAETRTGSVLSEGLSVSDPRLGMMMRVYGVPEESPLSVSFGGYLWLPLRKVFQNLSPHASDQDLRAMPRLVLAGQSHQLQWSLAASYLFRSEAHQDTLSPLLGDTAGSELQVGTHLSYSDKARGLSVGPELMLSTLVNPKGHALRPLYTELELLLGLHLQPTPALQVGLAAGAGLLRMPGTPDLRFLLRVAYTRALPQAARPALTPPLLPPLPVVLVPDSDGDGVSEPEDVCPDTPQGEHPDGSRPGCPAGDQDQDSVFDYEDLCPETAQGERPDVSRPGCPAEDPDLDSVAEDQDRDQDTVLDAEDACPDEPGSPSPEHGRNGCPGLVAVKGNRLLIGQPIVFASSTDTVLAQSFPTLQALADALVASPWIKRVRFEGHTDNRGPVAANQELSLRRARSVVSWLQAHGVDPARMEATGEGPAHPVASNDTEQGRAANRRVDIVILEPPAAPADGEHP